MTTYPALPKLSDDTPKSVKDAFGALESWLKQAQAAGGFVTAQKLLSSGYTLATDPQYHVGDTALATVVDGVFGVDVVEELYADTMAGVFLSRLLVSWLSNGVNDYQVDLIHNNMVLQGLTTEYTQCRFDGLIPGIYQVRVGVAGSSYWSTSTVSVIGAAKLPDPVPEFVVYLPLEVSGVRMVWLPSPAVDLAGYHLSYGSTWESSVIIARVGTVTEYVWYHTGPVDGHFWIVAVDYGGRESAPAEGGIVLLTGPLFDAGGVSAQVIDNTVLLRWLPAHRGNYPVDHYEVRRSDPSSVPFEVAGVVGTVSGTFTALYEQQAGGRKYWVRAVDAAGLASAPVSVYATVAANDYYQLYDQRVSAFDGTLVNAMKGNTGTLAAPVDLVTSYTVAFGSDTWAQQQTAGAVWYAQRGIAAGSYEEIVSYEPDAGPVLEYRIIMDVTRRSSGAVTLVPNISVRALSTDPWSDMGDAYEVQPSFGYRQVRYRLTFNGVDGGVCEVTRLDLRLQSTVITKHGTVTVSGSDVAGTVIWLTQSNSSGGVPWFTALRSIQLTPFGTTNLTAVWDVGPDPGPDHFSIYLFDATGARVSGSVSWSVTGV